jgi:hypothetical protein
VRGEIVQDQPATTWGATDRVRFIASHDFNPIEAAWALIKKRIRTVAPRTGPTLRCTAQRV